MPNPPRPRRGKQEELSLLDLYNQLFKQQTEYGAKVERLYDIFSGTLEFPKSVTNSNDSPGLWPDTGINVYAILPEYTLAEAFCTTGVLFNIGQGRYKYQFMLVQSDELRPRKNGKLYYRYSKPSSNSWSEWKRSLYQFELTGGKDEDGNPIYDDFGKAITDTEDEIPEDNEHNNSGAKTIVRVDKSRISERLSTERKIELTGIVQGSAMFDGTKDIQIDTSARQFYVPLNVQIEPGARDVIEHHLIAEIPASNDNQYDWIVVEGHIGGWEIGQGKCWFNAIISNRQGNFTHGFYVGTLGSNNLVVYKTPLGVLKVYVSLLGLADDMKISVYGSDTARIKHEVVVLDSTANLVWSLKDNAPHIENKTFCGDVEGTAKNAIDSSSSDKSNIQQHSDVDGNLFLVGVKNEKGKQIVYSDKNIQITPDSRLRAVEFEGNLRGTASSADACNYSRQVMVARNPSMKSYILATTMNETQRSRPVYDEEVYLKSDQHVLYAKKFESDDLRISEANIAKLTTTEALNIPSSATLTSLTDRANFNQINITNGISGKINMNEGQLVFSSRNKDKEVVMNVAGSHGEGVYRSRDNTGSCLYISGSLRPDRVYNAVYNDIAELFPCKIKSEPGDVLILDVSSEEETYIKSTEKAHCVVGVHSDTFGYLLGGEKGMTSEELESKYVPIGLAGRVKVNVIGKINKGDKLVATYDGCARAFNTKKDTVDEIIGYALESDDRTDKRRLKMKIS